MFTEILKIVPKLDQASLNTMERSLSGRFNKLAKGFGKGLKTAVKVGGITSLVGAAAGILDKLLNPLKETQEAIDKILSKADDISTNAKQFGTTSGKLFKLQQFGVANGLDPEALSVLIQKFQASVAEAKADPNKQTSVRNFADRTDMAEAFFEFIQGLQKLPDKQQQVLVQQEVFGEKQILKMADFMNSDFGTLQKRLGLKDSTKYTPGIEKMADLNDLSDEFLARRQAKDMESKSKLINRGMVVAKDQSEQKLLDQENKRIKSYEDLKALSMGVDKIMVGLENFFLNVIPIFTTAITVYGKYFEIMAGALTTVVDLIKKLLDSRLVRGIFGKDK